MAAFDAAWAQYTATTTKGAPRKRPPSSCELVEGRALDEAWIVARFAMGQVLAWTGAAWGTLEHARAYATAQEAHAAAFDLAPDVYADASWSVPYVEIRTPV